MAPTKVTRRPRSISEQYAPRKKREALTAAFFNKADTRIKVSVSSVRTFDECEQKYYYRQVRKLRHKVRPVAPELGILLHEYLDAYYRGLADLPAKESHAAAIKKMRTGAAKDIRVKARMARGIGQADAAALLEELPLKAERIAQRYFRARGLDDANRYDIILVEQELLQEVHKRTWVNVAKVDMVTRDRTTGRIELWEHKSTKDTPPDTVRIMDIQTATYAPALEELFGFHVDGIIWNYLLTVEPWVPKAVNVGRKDERMSLPGDSRSTWDTYVTALDAARQAAPDDRKQFYDVNLPQYQEMRDRFAPMEHDHYFKRLPFPVTESNRLIRDYIRLGTKLERAHLRFEDGVLPVMSLTRNCNYCEFMKLCRAILIGDDEQDAEHLIGYEYTTTKEIRDAVEIEEP